MKVVDCLGWYRDERRAKMEDIPRTVDVKYGYAMLAR